MNLKWSFRDQASDIPWERLRYVIDALRPALRAEARRRDAPLNADLRLVFLGDDAEGVALEVMAIELEDDTLLVIHAMPLREPLSKAVRGDQEMAKVKKTTRQAIRGRRLETEIAPEIADALAAEAERGYDLSKAKLSPRSAALRLAGAGAFSPVELPHDP